MKMKSDKNTLVTPPHKENKKEERNRIQNNKPKILKLL